MTSDARTTTSIFCILLLCCGCHALEGEPEDVTFTEAYSRLICRQALSCCKSSQLAELEGIGKAVTDEQACMAVVGPVVRERVGLDRLQLRVRRGLRDYDVAAATRCLEQIEARGCVTLEGEADLHSILRTSPVCRQIWPGLLLIGDSCTSSDDCGRQSACIDSSCRPLPPPETPCLAGRCLPGAYCGTGSLCAARLGEGESCTRDEACQQGRCIEGRCGEPPAVAWCQ